MNDTRNWTVIYANGWEEIRVKAQPDSALNWEYSDGAGPLEEISWAATNTVKDLRTWLAAHKIDSDTFSKADDTPAWENVFGKCSGKTTVKNLVAGVRDKGDLAL